MNMSALEMTGMARPIGAPMQMVWTPAYAGLIALMWWVMMIAMMTPSAAPTLLLFTALKRHGADRGNTAFHSLLFLLGYLLIWALFSLPATAAQLALVPLGLISGSMMTISSQLFAGFVLIGAGAFQFSSLKTACLRHCRSPAQFLSDHRRPGAVGAVLMGAHHGVFCLGCCWALMALLFVGGVMNLYWIVGLAIYVIVEKSLPMGQFISRTAGSGLVAFGLYLVISSLVGSG
jgi:predicted metal-binding membrane protein